LTNTKFTDNPITNGGGGVCGIRRALNRGDYKDLTPKEPVIRMAEIDGKIVTSVEKKAEKKATRKAKKDDPLLQKYAIKTEAETKGVEAERTEAPKKPIKKIKK
jgi:hypothetical protein